MNAGTLKSVLPTYRSGSSGVNYRFIRGSSTLLSGTFGGIDIIGEDWDNLVILDACRYDVFEATNEIPGRLQRITSKGANTPEFLERNFANRSLYDTVYISANAMIGELSNLLDVYKLIGLWDEQTRTSDAERTEASWTRHTHPASLPNPERVVNRTLDIGHEYPNKRLIAHFVQPHTPFLVKDGTRLPPDSPYRTFTAVANDRISEREMREVYEENVEYVLEHVARLVRKLRGKTVVTADHGELLGEGVPTYIEWLHPRWSFENRHRFDYGHYRGVRLPELVHVPWLVIDSDDRPVISDAGRSVGMEISESSIEDQLEALGYR